MPTVKINNIPRWVSEIHLKQFFNGCGKILQANIAKDQTSLRPLGYGFLEFSDDEAINTALKKDGSSLDGSIIQVELYQEPQIETNI